MAGGHEEEERGLRPRPEAEAELLAEVTAKCGKPFFNGYEHRARMAVRRAVDPARLAAAVRAAPLGMSRGETLALIEQQAAVIPPLPSPEPALVLVDGPHSSPIAEEHVQWAAAGVDTARRRLAELRGGR